MSGNRFGTIEATSFNISSTSPILKIISDTASSSEIYLGDTANNSIGKIRYNQTTDTFSINTSSTERFKIDSSGKVGIGATPSYQLDVKNTVASTYAAATPATWNTVASFMTTGTTAGNNAFINMGTSSPNVNTQIGVVQNASNLGDMVFVSYVGSSVWQENMRIVSNGKITIPNQAIIQGGANIPWTTGKSYSVDDVVLKDGYLIKCLSAHTSGTYTSDVTLGYWQIAHPMKNFLINGGMDIWQRGVSITSYTNASLLADRWKMNLDSGSPATGNAQQNAVGVGTSMRSKYWLTVSSPATGATGFRSIFQTIESYRLLENKVISVSFYVYCAISTTFNCRFVDGTNPNGATFSSASSQTVPALTVTKVTLTLSAITTSTSSLFWIYWADVNNQSVYITDIMLNEGPAPAAFQPAGNNYQDELAMCQRYFQLFFVDYEFNALTAANGWGFFPLAVTPRVTTGASLSTPTGNNITSATVTIVGSAARISSNITANGYARYQGTITVNSEL